MKQKTNYDEIAEPYSSQHRYEHPQRKHVLYSTWLEECGDLKGKKVLDVGCGSGLSSRLLAEKGAIVTGIDSSQKMLEIAQEIEKENPMGITYLLKDAHKSFKFDELFDLVTPSLLLHYSRTENELDITIQNVSNNLKQGGKMVAMNTRLDEPVREYKGEGLSHSSRWIGEPFQNGSEIELTVYSSEKGLAKFSNYFWSKETYEKFFKKHGLTDIQWIPLHMDEEGKKLYPNWRELEEKVILMVVSATKG